MSARQITQSDLILLAQWLDAEGWSLEEFIQVLEKPHHFLDELDAARAVAEIPVDLEGMGA